MIHPVHPDLLVGEVHTWHQDGQRQAAVCRLVQQARGVAEPADQTARRGRP